MELVSLEAFSLASKPSINLLFKGKCISREGLFLHLSTLRLSFIFSLIINIDIPDNLLLPFFSYFLEAYIIGSPVLYKHSLTINLQILSYNHRFTVINIHVIKEITCVDN